jgi:hypothetical protein
MHSDRGNGKLAYVYVAECCHYYNAGAVTLYDLALTEVVRTITTRNSELYYGRPLRAAVYDQPALQCHRIRPGKREAVTADKIAWRVGRSDR